MIVCHCRRVNDTTIRRSVEAGADTVDAVGRTCGAGTVCGGCRPAIARILETTEAELAPAAAPDGVASPVRRPSADRSPRQAVAVGSTGG